jgi:hypothetical protein
MISAFTVAMMHHGGRDDRQLLGTPRPGLGLLNSKAQRHGDH